MSRKPIKASTAIAALVRLPVGTVPSGIALSLIRAGLDEIEIGLKDLKLAEVRSASARRGDEQERLKMREKEVDSNG